MLRRWEAAELSSEELLFVLRLLIVKNCFIFAQASVHHSLDCDFSWWILDTSLLIGFTVLLWKRQGGWSMQNMALKCQCAVHISSFLGPLSWTGPLDLDRQVALFAWLISHQPAILFSQNKPATSNQPTVLFSQNKPAPATSQPNRLIYSVRLVFYVQTLLNPLLSPCDFMHAPDKKFRWQGIQMNKVEQGFHL
jgi:hypothetical protein